MSTTESNPRSFAAAKTLRDQTAHLPAVPPGRDQSAKIKTGKAAAANAVLRTGAEEECPVRTIMLAAPLGDREGPFKLGRRPLFTEEYSNAK